MASYTRAVGDATAALQVVNGSPRPVSATAVTTGSQIAITGGKCYLVQADAIFYCYTSDGTLSAPSATTGLILQAGQAFVFWSNALDTVLYCVSAAGTANVRLLELT